MAKQWQMKIGIGIVLIIAIYFAYKRKMGPFGMPEIQELLGGKPEAPTLVAGGDVSGAGGAGLPGAPAPNQFQGPSAPIGTGGLSGPQVKPDEDVRQTFLREMYKQVYLPYQDYPFLYDNPGLQNQTGTPVRGGDLPPCAPTDDAWFDMWYKLYGFHPPGSTSNQNCTPNPFPTPGPTPTPSPACPQGYKADRCNCRCIPQDTPEIQSLCPEAERCPYPQFYPDPLPDTPGTGGWENCGINPHAPPCCLPPTNDPMCRTCRERFGEGCGSECNNGTRLTDPSCVACKTCYTHADAVCNESQGYRWDVTLNKCVRPPVPTPTPTPSPSSCFKSCHDACKNQSSSNRGRCISNCAHTCFKKKPPGTGFGLWDWLRKFIGRDDFDVRDFCKKDSGRCRSKYHGSCSKECRGRDRDSKKCKECTCACSGRSNYAVASYNARHGVRSTPGYGYAFGNNRVPEGVLLQRANSARVHLA